jgi:hypothetical protein
MSYTVVVPHPLSCGALLWTQAMLAESAFAVTNPLILLFALASVNPDVGTSNARGAYDDFPEEEFVGVHTAVVVGFWFLLLAAQAYVKHLVCGVK